MQIYRHPDADKFPSGWIFHVETRLWHVSVARRGIGDAPKARHNNRDAPKARLYG